MADGGGRLIIQGGKELRRSLRRAGADLKDLSKINRAAVAIVLPVARTTAPMGPAAGGHIRDTLRTGATQTRGEIRAGNKSKPYGPILQWGWRARGIEPHTWVVEAAKTTEAQWLALYERELVNLLNSVKGH
ncbi:hypothetical protein M3686_04780 [Micrococcus luteus]|uniref:hypothetical protein n=1 Tax=Micrococcus luteus TaxID=1270 RepID=UPI00203FB061|nr:hypothetical protein [Micrococcus luteus]MCM3577449.1 hypothetical protein [Micrococcus luteus]